MKSLSITIDEKVAAWARSWAARNKTSVSRLVAELPRERMQQEQSYRAAMKRYLAQSPVTLKQSGQYPSREELHDRNGVR